MQNNNHQPHHYAMQCQHAQSIIDILSAMLVMPPDDTTVRRACNAIRQKLTLIEFAKDECARIRNESEVAWQNHLASASNAELLRDAVVLDPSVLEGVAS